MKLHEGMRLPATLHAPNWEVSVPLEYQGREASLNVHGDYWPEMAFFSVCMEVRLGEWVFSFANMGQDWKDRWTRYGHEVLFIADLPEEQRQLPDGLVHMIKEQLDYLIDIDAENESEVTA